MPLFKLPGIHVPHHKNTDKMKAVRMPIPKEVILQMNMHIGAFAKPIVNVGDHVLVGQKIAQAGGYISAPVHSSVSGVVKKNWKCSRIWWNICTGYFYWNRWFTRSI